MLDRHCAIDEESGRYVQRVAGVSNMDMIGQRLYTGRMVIAGACCCLRGAPSLHCYLLRSALLCIALFCTVLAP